MISFAGPVARPRSAVVRLPDGVVRFSRPLSAEVTAHARRPGTGGHEVLDGAVYTACVLLTAEADAGTTSAVTVSVRRVRPDLG